MESEPCHPDSGIPALPLLLITHRQRCPLVPFTLLTTTRKVERPTWAFYWRLWTVNPYPPFCSPVILHLGQILRIWVVRLVVWIYAKVVQGLWRWPCGYPSVVAPGHLFVFRALSLVPLRSTVWVCRCTFPMYWKASLQGKRPIIIDSVLRFSSSFESKLVLRNVKL